MTHYWVIGALLLGCISVADFCEYPDQCVYFTRCKDWVTIYSSRNPCQYSYVCCRASNGNPPPSYVPQANWQQSGYQYQPTPTTNNYQWAPSPNYYPTTTTRTYYQPITTTQRPQNGNQFPFPKPRAYGYIENRFQRTLNPPSPQSERNYQTTVNQDPFQTGTPNTNNYQSTQNDNLFGPTAWGYTENQLQTTPNQPVLQKIPLSSTTANLAPPQARTPNMPPIKESSYDNLCGLGHPSGPGQYPWVVALYRHGNYFGGGSLIAPGVVLTAAHLVMNISAIDIVVRAGEWDMASASESFRHEERGVDKVEPHEDFSYQSSTNNIALLYLKSPFELKAHIRTICLPGEEKTFDQKRCLMAGWGKLSFQDRYNSNKQKSVELPMVKREDCQNQLRRTRMGPNFELHESLICAGGQRDKDACTGDGGSPLFCALEDDPNRYEQAGIVSFGIGCNRENVPGTFTNVAMFRDYIDQKLAGGTFEL